MHVPHRLDWFVMFFGGKLYYFGVKITLSEMAAQFEEKYNRRESFKKAKANIKRAKKFNNMIKIRKHNKKA